MARDLPTWIDTLVSRLAAMFALGGWRIHLYPENADSRPHGYENSDGLTSMKTDYYEARIFFDRDLEPDPAGLELVAHEVLHLAFADMHNAVKDITSFVVGEDEQDKLFAIYERVEEQTITRLARGMARDFDFKAWLEPESKEIESKTAASARAVDREELRERLADLAHQQWAGWMTYLFEKSPLNGDGSRTIPMLSVMRWQRQLDTPYVELPEDEQTSDRKEADRVLAVLDGEPDINAQPSSWWLISDEDVQLMKRLLEEMAGIGDMRVVRLRHTLDTGLHKTDAVPSDGAEGADE